MHLNEIKSEPIEYYDIDMDDQLAWDFITFHKFKSLFQLDKTAVSWMKKMPPRNILELADLISIIRPGCANAKMDDKTMTQHYCDRKNGVDYPKPLHPALKDILNDTYQILVYQEQAIKIASELAGFSLQEADSLRKAMGKKDAELMASLEQRFIDGCLKIGKVNEQDAKFIFDIIRASNRYSFNKSHAVSYAYIGYWTLYAKTYKLRKFYRSFLRRAKNKIDSESHIVQLINEAKTFDINVEVPTLRTLKKEFHIDHDTEDIRFGLCDVKGVGEAQIDKLINNIDGYDLSNCTWYDFLIRFGKPSCINKNAITALITVGALDYMDTAITRQQKLLQYEKWNNLTAKEQEWIQHRSGILPKTPTSQTKNAMTKYQIELADYSKYKDNPIKSLQEGMKKLLLEGKLTKSRITKVQDVLRTLLNPPFDTDDNVKWIISQEKKLLGISLSKSSLDKNLSRVGKNTCIEFDSIESGPINLVVEIVESRTHNIKNGPNKGQEMLFVTVQDKTSVIDNIAIFTDLYKEKGHMLYIGNVVMLDGYKSHKGFTVNNIKEVKEL